VRNLDAPQNQPAIGDQTMDIVSDADVYHDGTLWPVGLGVNAENAMDCEVVHMSFNFGRS
jgi:hypothetical protein